jgi:hypothetical protein
VTGNDTVNCIYCTMFGVTSSVLITSCTVFRHWRRRSDCYLVYYNIHPHVTTFTHNYSLRGVTFTQLTILHIRNYNHLLHSYTFTLADFSAISYFLKLSQTLHLHTSKLSPRTYSANSLLKTATYNWLVGLLLTNSLVELLPKNWLCIADGFQDNSSERTPPKTVAIIVLIA